MQFCSVTEMDGRNRCVQSQARPMQLCGATEAAGSQLALPKGAKDWAIGWTPLMKAHCLILGFATEYSTSVKKFTATYVNPIARMQPCTR